MQPFKEDTFDLYENIC